MCHGGETPQAGDLFLLEPYDSKAKSRYIASRDANGKATLSGHIGIITEVKDGRMYFVEGNSNECVHESSIPIQTKQGNKYWVQGYLRPNYSNSSTSTTPVPTQVPSNPSLNVTATKADGITATNAKVYGSCSKTSDINIEKCGVYLGTTDANMTRLNTESVPSSTNKHNSGKSFDIWYDLNSELKVTLKPGVTYYYQFYCTYNNKEYVSNVSSFTTQGTHQCDSVTYTWSSDHSTCYANRTCSTIAIHNMSETANSTVNEIPATSTSNGSRVYTAAFACDVFQTQTYTEAIPMTGVTNSDIRVVVYPVENLTSVSATICAHCEKTSSDIKMDTYGFYAGTSENDLKKMDSQAIPSEANDYNNGTGFSIRYNLNLKPGVTYYYRFFCTYQGTEYSSDIYSITGIAQTSDESANIPDKTQFWKAKAFKKSMILSWNKVSSGDGYLIQYSTNSSFSNAKKVWVRGNSKSAKWIFNLSKGTTYYVRIRTYKDVETEMKTTRYYSGWSTVKTMTTTK